MVRPARPSGRPHASTRTTVGLAVVVLVLTALMAIGVVALLGEGSPAAVVLGLVLAGMLATGLVAVVLVVGHRRRDRLEVVVGERSLTLPAPPGLPWINRVFATLATLLIVPPLLSLVQRDPVELPIFARATALIIGLLAVPAAVRAWRGRARYTSLTLTPDGLRVVGGRGSNTLDWEDVLGVRIVGARLRIADVDGSTAIDLGVRDLASDARLVADVVDLYRRRPALRPEIGAGALARWERGDLT
ncbi:hypothetical protein SERN_1266 [Serinibacter arcticus]|uniref:Low molecular weight protein antigen 6 PH domain-containing protein n=1 Tax=Serinibacter arcticus TaxID=1655435 RepID=A0A4Z1E3D1_9MICO|nr:hypothetical protein SERN_1266 [Serinibacter arcticus]